MSDQPLFFRGAEGYQEIIRDEYLSRTGRAIRVYNYGGPSGNEMIYVIGTEKLLFNSRTGKQVKPEEVFSREAAPDGWSVEGWALDLLPEAEIEKILKHQEPQIKNKPGL
jgi:hypothetical protein